MNSKLYYFFIPCSELYVCEYNDFVIVVLGGKPESIINLNNVLTVQGIDNDHYYLHGEHNIRKKTKLIGSSSVTDSTHIKPCYSFEVHYVVERKLKFRAQKAVFCSFDAVLVTKWLGELTKRLEGEYTNKSARMPSGSQKMSMSSVLEHRGLGYCFVVQ